MTLREKLHKIYETVEFIEKSGHNKSQNYDFLQAVAVIRAVRKQLIELRVYAEINFDFVGGPYTIAREKAPNAPFSAINVKCSILFYDLDTGETSPASGLGGSADTGDKAIYKAQTGALKYALKNAFLIPDEADPEADESVDCGTSTESDFQEVQAAPKALQAARPTPAPAKAGASNAPSPIAATSTKSAASTAPAPAADVPATTSAAPVAEREPGDEPDDALPTEEQMNGENGFHAQFVALKDELKGKLLPSKNPSIPVNRKLLVFLLSVTGVDNAAKISIFQWEDFFRRVDAVRQSAHGLPGLVVLINRANGVETK